MNKRGFKIYEGFENWRENIKKVPQYYKVEVNENRAPTDDSIRLLNEMQEKVIRNVLSTIKVDDNDLNFVALYMRDNTIMCGIDIFVKFSLNGKEYIVENYFEQNYFNDDLKLYQSHFDIFIKNLYQKVTHIITENLIRKNYDKLSEIFLTKEIK